ncbi:MAG TPA: tripartite tricarboxylate transporter substrate-binding protein [Rubrobacter sp.]|nr:tripartite tricarboxylate transporter substrate-binding protein [Rubrobacter sp.]
MREGVLVLVLALALGAAGVGCSGEGGESAGRTAGDGGAGDRGARGAGRPVENDLGHQAFQPSTRLVVPAATGLPLDRVARVLAGLSEGPLGTRLFVDDRPGGGGQRAWRDVADEEPDGHQLAYVTEELLASAGSGSGGVRPEDFEMAAQTDTGFAVLVAKGDPEVETLQWEDFEGFGDFLAAAKEDPGFVEVADPGSGTVYRAGTLALEEEIGIDLSPKAPSGKSPTQAVYDADVETALVPLDAVVLSDVLAGELEALAMLGDRRCRELPDVPTVKELGHDVVVPVFGGIAVPDGTPEQVVEELGRAFVASSSSETFGRALVGTARLPAQKGPEEFTSFVEEQERWISESGGL